MEYFFVLCIVSVVFSVVATYEPSGHNVTMFFFYFKSFCIKFVTGATPGRSDLLNLLVQS